MTTSELTETERARLTGHVLVFDSGMGGLTVARELADMAPNVLIDYAADTAFFPYGDKSDRQLRARLPKVAKALVEAVCPDVFVIACNTASTLALEEVRAALSVPVIGTVPAIKPAALQSKTGAIGLLATPGTIRRAYTDQLIEDFAQTVHVAKHGSIALVELAEAVARGETPALDAFAKAQKALFDGPEGERIDTIVLACTHFPLVRQQLIDSAPQEICYIDSGEAIARQTLRQLARVVQTSPPDRLGQTIITSAVERNEQLVTVFGRFGFSPTLSVDVPA